MTKDDQIKQIGLSSDGRVDFSACRQHAEQVCTHEPVAPAPIKVEFEHRYDSRIAPDCKSCKESCCVAPHVTTLRLSDVRRLHDAGFGWAIATLMPHPSAKKHTNYPSLKQMDGRCVFLDDEDRCSIYPIRPWVCRAFPFQVADDGTFIRYASTCGSQRRAKNPLETAHMAESAAASYMQKASDRTTIGQWKKRPDATPPQHSDLRHYYETQPAGTSVRRTFQDILEDKKRGNSDTIVESAAED
jgi:Fe-S-cluster containining protein